MATGDQSLVSSPSRPGRPRRQVRLRAQPPPWSFSAAAPSPSARSFAKSLASRSSPSPPAVAAATSAAQSPWGFSCPPAAVPARFWRISGAEPPSSCSTPAIRNRLPSSDPVDPRRRPPPVGPISPRLPPFLAPTTPKSIAPSRRCLDLLLPLFFSNKSSNSLIAPPPPCSIQPASRQIHQA